MSIVIPDPLFIASYYAAKKCFISLLCKQKKHKSLDVSIDDVHSASVEAQEKSFLEFNFPINFIWSFDMHQDLMQVLWLFYEGHFPQLP